MIGEAACNSKRPWIICAEAKCIPANGDSAGEAGIEVLDLSSVDAGSIVLDPEPISCAEAISEVSDGVKAIASAKASQFLSRLTMATRLSSQIKPDFGKSC